jgi:triosephosphate isomerase (TIM)
LIDGLKPLVADSSDVEVVVCPTFTALESVAGLVAGTNIKLGAQNCYFEASGAYTGEISVGMLKDIGCEYCIIGHSERREYFGETDEGVNKKAKALLKAGIKPIICVGESLEQRESEQTQAVVAAQIRGAYDGLSAEQAAITVIAYEPISAIGTGKTATPEMAQDVHGAIRALLVELYDADTAAAIRIQYGGSMKPTNAAELRGQEDIDGGLIGGAALKPDDFAGIVNA